MMFTLIVRLMLQFAAPSSDFDERAIECAATDYACLDDHDYNVLVAALLTDDPFLCADKAVVPRRCFAEFKRVYGKLGGGK